MWRTENHKLSWFVRGLFQLLRDIWENLKIRPTPWRKVLPNSYICTVALFIFQKPCRTRTRREISYAIHFLRWGTDDGNWADFRKRIWDYTPFFVSHFIRSVYYGPLPLLDNWYLSYKSRSLIVKVHNAAKNNLSIQLVLVIYFFHLLYWIFYYFRMLYRLK